MKIQTINKTKKKKKIHQKTENIIIAKIKNLRVYEYRYANSSDTYLDNSSGYYFFFIFYLIQMKMLESIRSLSKIKNNHPDKMNPYKIKYLPIVENIKHRTVLFYLCELY